MQDYRVATTNNRQVVGVLVDFGKALPYYLEDDGSLLSVSFKLSKTPCSPLYKTSTYPDRATRLILDGAPVKPRGAW